jgi:peptide/nickel transport system ATP-binding protein
VGVVFQDPGSSLNPRWPIGQSIAEPLTLHTTLSRAERDNKVKTLLDQVQLPASMGTVFRTSFPADNVNVWESPGRSRWNPHC